MMILFWISLGALIASAGWYVYLKFHVPGRMSTASWISAISAILCGVFTLAWAVASVEEHEMQAAGMGLLVFGALTLILVSVTRKLLLPNSFPKSQEKNNVVVE